LSKKFNEYYKYYLSLHQNKWCRRFHVLGQLATISFITLCVIKAFWILLCFSPFVVYPFAWIGHLAFEKNNPLAWKGFEDYGRSALKAKACDLIMFKDWILGKVER